MSAKKSLDTSDFKKIATGAGIAAAGVILASVVDATTGMTEGYMPVLYVVCSVLLNALRQYVKETTKGDGNGLSP